jgi:hypothetical protein
MLAFSEKPRRRRSRAESWNHWHLVEVTVHQSPATFVCRFRDPARFINFTATRLCLLDSDDDLDLKLRLLIQPTVAPRSFPEQLSSFAIASELLKLLVVDSIPRNTFTNLSIRLSLQSL